mmetsp:Transcript_73877/g.203881  ORF Transcript_73877/g.203881 Transcript_73877/m.203881 type:complete len:208 (+) Transcript_73877:193-816(+)
MSKFLQSCITSSAGLPSLAKMTRANSMSTGMNAIIVQSSQAHHKRLKYCGPHIATKFWQAMTFTGSTFNPSATLPWSMQTWSSQKVGSRPFSLWKSLTIRTRSLNLASLSSFQLCDMKKSIVSPGCTGRANWAMLRLPVRPSAVVACPLKTSTVKCFHSRHLSALRAMPNNSSHGTSRLAMGRVWRASAASTTKVSRLISVMKPSRQ